MRFPDEEAANAIRAALTLSVALPPEDARKIEALISQNQALQERIEVLEHELESWRVTEAVRSNPDYPRQLAEFELIVRDRPCAICGSPEHNGMTHALSPTQETDPE